MVRNAATPCTSWNHADWCGTDDRSLQNDTFCNGSSVLWFQRVPCGLRLLAQQGVFGGAYNAKSGRFRLGCQVPCGSDGWREGKRVVHRKVARQGLILSTSDRVHEARHGTRVGAESWQPACQEQRRRGVGVWLSGALRRMVVVSRASQLADRARYLQPRLAVGWCGEERPERIRIAHAQ